MSFQNLIAAAIFIAGVAAAPASAQNVDTQALQEQMAEQIEAAKQRLNLSEDQIPQVEAILRDSGEQRRAVLETYGVDGDDGLSLREKRRLRGEFRTIREETKSSLSTVLSEEQLAEFEQIQEEQRQELRARASERNR